MATITRPMLAATVTYEELSEIEWPVLCSPKVDGIRCMIHPSLGPVTRSFKSLPNAYTRERLEWEIGHSYLDGELIAVGKDGNALPFNATQSAMMSHSGRPAFKFMVFDSFERPDWDFATRHQHARYMVKRWGYKHVKILKHEMVHNLEGFCKFTDRCIAAGFEGSIIRAPAGIYKNGRSTRKQGWLLKYKEWADAEGTIIGFVELMHNSNPDVRDKFDLAKRSSAKDGMVPMNTLGALIIDTEWGQLSIGSGFDQATRQAIWNRNQPLDQHGNVIEDYTACDITLPDIGRTITFKYQPHGMQDLPRFPIFMHFRKDE